MAGWWTPGSGHAYGLTVQGVQIIDHVPVDVAPITWETVGPDATGRLSFTYFGPKHLIHDGGEVRLTDNTNRRTLFGGIMLERRLTRGVGDLVWSEVECASYDWFLDHRIVPRYTNKRDVGDRKRHVESDRQVVKDLIERRGAFIEATNTYVDETTTALDRFELEGETLRSALEKIAEEAQTGSSAGRHFYVDDDKFLHWFSGTEGLTAPYRIADGSYVRDIIATSGLVEYWTLREAAGTTNYGTQGVADLTLAGSYTQNQTSIGVINDQAHRSVLFTATGRAEKTSAPSSLFPGDTFSLETWFRRSTTGTLQYVFLSTGGSDDAYEVFFNTDDKLYVRLRPAGVNNFVSTATVTDGSWHHLIIAHNPGDTTVYYDGAAWAGTHTNRVFGSAATTFTLGHSTSGYVGWRQHAAVYNAKLSAATALAHYRQGISILPENLELSYDSEEERHFAYVISEVKGGSGWVRPDAASPWALGATQMYVEAPHVKTENQRERRGKAALRRARKVVGCDFEITGYDGWAPGQLLTVTESSLGLSATTFEIKSVSGELSAGQAPTYRIEAGVLRKRLTRHIKRRKHRKHR